MNNQSPLVSRRFLSLPEAFRRRRTLGDFEAENVDFLSKIALQERKMSKNRLRRATNPKNIIYVSKTCFISPPQAENFGVEKIMINSPLVSRMIRNKGGINQTNTPDVYFLGYFLIVDRSCLFNCPKSL